MKKLFVVTDWANDPLMFPQFYTAVEGRVKDPSTRPTIIPVGVSSSPLQASYIARQIIQIENKYGRPDETLILMESASHSHVNAPSETGASAPFYILRLESGMHVMGTNAGFTFSLLKDLLGEVLTYQGIDAKVPFGARDEYARMCAYLMDYMEDELEFDEVHTNVIPELDAPYIGHVDAFGNIQTTIVAEDLKGRAEYKQSIGVKIKGRQHDALFLPNRYASNKGALVLSPSAVGHPDNPYLELSVWSDNPSDLTKSACAQYNHPHPGDKIEVANN
jgi:hypothetical protein